MNKEMKIVDGFEAKAHLEKTGLSAEQAEGIVLELVRIEDNMNNDVNTKHGEVLAEISELRSEIKSVVEKMDAKMDASFKTMGEKMEEKIKDLRTELISILSIRFAVFLTVFGVVLALAVK